MSLWPGLSATVLTALLGPTAVFAGDAPAARGNLSLEVRVVGIDGKPVEKSSVGLWRLVTGPELREKESGDRGSYLWREAGSDRVWEAVGGASTGDRLLQDGLAPGTYRATGHLGSRQRAAPGSVGTGRPCASEGQDRARGWCWTVDGVTQPWRWGV